MEENLSNFALFNTGIDRTIANNIINFCTNNFKLHDAQVGSDEDGIVDKSVRDSQVSFVSLDSWIAGIMHYYIHDTNNEIFNYDLKGWHGDIQYTEYLGKGSKYNWHYDMGSPELENGVRKLSISICLSDTKEYDGGQFQIMTPGDRGMITLKMGLGDCIVFPSWFKHRVRPLKSGKRISLVGWYAGPPFR